MRPTTPKTGTARPIRIPELYRQLEDNAFLVADADAVAGDVAGVELLTLPDSRRRGPYTPPPPPLIEISQLHSSMQKMFALRAVPCRAVPCREDEVVVQSRLCHIAHTWGDVCGHTSTHTDYEY